MKEHGLIRAAIYARVSTDKQRGNYSVSLQIERCLEYLEKRGYYLVGDRFVAPDTGRDVSPSTPGALAAYVDDESSLTMDRPALNAFMRFCTDNDVDRLIIYRVDRFGRDFLTTGLLEAQLNGLGVTIEFVEGGYDDTPEGELRKDFATMLAKYENMIRRTRVIQGKKKKAESGKFVSGRPPFGYDLRQEANERKTGDDEQATTAFGGLAINEEEAAVVRQIFSLYLEKGLSIRGIVDKLNADGVPTRRGGVWARSTVRKILSNETYAGTHHYNKTQTRHQLKGKVQEARDRSEWIPIEVPAIISRSVFEAVQDKRKRNRNRRRRKAKQGRFYLLRSMITCSSCGKPYVAQARRASKSSRIGPSLVYRHRKKEGHCTNHQISASIIETFVWDSVRDTIMNPKRLIEGYERTLKKQKSRLHEAHEQLAYLEEKRVEIEVENKRLINLILKERISDQDFDMAKAELEQRAERIDGAITELREEIQQQPVRPSLESFRAFTAKVREYLLKGHDPPAVEKRRVLEMLAVEVWVKPGTREIEVKGEFEEGDSNDGSGETGGNIASAVHYALQPPPPPSHA